jgi:hypothetical protein
MFKISKYSNLKNVQILKKCSNLKNVQTLKIFKKIKKEKEQKKRKRKTRIKQEKMKKEKSTQKKEKPTYRRVNGPAQLRAHAGGAEFRPANGRSIGIGFAPTWEQPSDGPSQFSPISSLFLFSIQINFECA